jgi:hypothetical protein
VTNVEEVYGWVNTPRPIRFHPTELRISAGFPLTDIYTYGRGRTDHEGPEGEWRYISTLFITVALDGGGWSTPRSGRFSPVKDPVPVVQEAGCAEGPVWTGGGKSRPPPARNMCIHPVLVFHPFLLSPIALTSLANYITS